MDVVVVKDMNLGQVTICWCWQLSEGTDTCSSIRFRRKKRRSNHKAPKFLYYLDLHISLHDIRCFTIEYVCILFTHSRRVLKTILIVRQNLHIHTFTYTRLSVSQIALIYAHDMQTTYANYNTLPVQCSTSLFHRCGYKVQYNKHVLSASLESRWCSQCKSSRY